MENNIIEILKLIFSGLSSFAIIVAIFQLYAVLQNTKVQMFKSELDIYDRLSAEILKQQDINKLYSELTRKLDNVEYDSSEYYNIKAELCKTEEEINKCDRILFDLLELYCYNINKKRLENEFAIRMYGELFAGLFLGENKSDENSNKYCEINSFIENNKQELEKYKVNTSN